jgi:hypothetical protein
LPPSLGRRGQNLKTADYGGEGRVPVETGATRACHGLLGGASRASGDRRQHSCRDAALAEGLGEQANSEGAFGRGHASFLRIAKRRRMGGQFLVSRAHTMKSLL